MKFNSQICTTKEQSERLLVLGLKKETADMMFSVLIKDFRGKDVPNAERVYSLCTWYEETSMSVGLEKREYIPAWSLHRLKCLLPDITPYGDGYLTIEIINENVYIILTIEGKEKRILKYTKENLYDNLIDCINFFVKESLFNKEYLE